MTTLEKISETTSKGRWQWQSNPNPWNKKETPQWKSYPLEHNYLIEKAYYDQKKEIDVGDYRVSIRHMIQKKKGSMISQRPIRRINWEDDVQEIIRSQRYFETEIPKTINKVFGSLGDFISFFSRRNPEILEFTNDFKEIEQLPDLNILNQKIVPRLISCLEETLLKPNLEQQKNFIALSKLKKKLILDMNVEITTLISLFKKEFLSIEEFYGHILKAYTMNTDLYPILNNYLRNENWIEVDKLLPYAFCLCKAFFNLKPKTDSAQYSQILEPQTLSSILLFRGTAFDEFSLSFYNREKGHCFSWNSVTSTSKDNKIAEEFMYKNADLANRKYPVVFVIEVPVSGEFEAEYLKWIDIQQYSVIPKEDEVIFPPGSVFELQEIVTDQNKITTIKIKLRNEIKSLAHGGMMMQGALQSQLMTEKEAKIMCLDGEELNQALMGLSGNKLIEEVEFCLCTFDKKLLRKMLEILPTLKRGKILRFIACNSEDNGEITDEGPIGGERCEIIKLEVIGASNFFQMIFNEKWDQKHWVSLRELDLDFRSRRSIKDGELDDEVSRWLKYLPQLASLNINLDQCTDITDDGVNSLARSLNFLTQLAHLNMNFKYCYQITDKGVENLAKSIGCLTHLTNLNLNFKCYKQITDNGMNNLSSQWFKSLSQLKFLNLGFDRLLPQEIGYLTQLTSLTLDNLFYNDKELSSFVSDGMKHLLQLTSLTLPFWHKTGKEITDQGLEAFACQGLKSLLLLTSLDLRFNNFDQITDKGVESLASQGLKHLVHLKSLTLQFYSCDQITDEGVDSLMFQGLQSLTQLTSLTLDFLRCYKTKEKAMEILASKWLRKLPVFDFLAIRNRTLYTIDIQSQHQLRSSRRLKLARESSRKDKRFLDEGFFGLPSENCNLKMIQNSSKSLKQSEKKNSQDILDKLIATIKKNEDTLKTLEIFPEIRQLTSLNLNFKNYQSTDKFVYSLGSQILKHFPHLRFLTLSFGYSGITDKGVSYLALYGLKSLVNLASLNLDFSNCDNITDKGMMNLAWEGLRHLSHLKSLTLNFSSCDELTHKGWTHLAWNGLRHLSQLESLVLQPCLETTDKGVDSLVSQGFKYLTQLKSLSFDFYESRITDKGVNNFILQVIKNLPQLTSLDLDFELTENISDFTIQNITKVLHYFGFTKEIDEITKSDGYEIEETDEYIISFRD